MYICMYVLPALAFGLTVLYIAFFSFMNICSCMYVCMYVCMYEVDITVKDS